MIRELSSGPIVHAPLSLEGAVDTTKGRRPRLVRRSTECVGGSNSLKVNGLQNKLHIFRRHLLSVALRNIGLFPGTWNHPTLPILRTPMIENLRKLRRNQRRHRFRHFIRVMRREYLTGSTGFTGWELALKRYFISARSAKILSILLIPSKFFWVAARLPCAFRALRGDLNCSF